MAGLSTIDGDLLVRGSIRANSIPLPNQSVGNTQFSSTDPLAASKQDHQYSVLAEQPHGVAAVADRFAVHIAYGAGQLVDVRMGLTVACVGDSTVTVDVLKNGSTVLSATVTLDSADAGYAKVPAGIASGAYSAGDVFEVAVTVSAGTGTLGQGLFVGLVFREAAQ